MIWPCDFCELDFIDKESRDEHHKLHDPTDPKWWE